MNHLISRRELFRQIHYVVVQWNVHLCNQRRILIDHNQGSLFVTSMIIMMKFFSSMYLNLSIFICDSHHHSNTADIEYQNEIYSQSSRTRDSLLSDMSAHAHSNEYLLEYERIRTTNVHISGEIPPSFATIIVSSFEIVLLNMNTYIVMYSKEIQRRDLVRYLRRVIRLKDQEVLPTRMKIVFNGDNNEEDNRLVRNRNNV